MNTTDGALHASRTISCVYVRVVPNNVERKLRTYWSLNYCRYAKGAVVAQKFCLLFFPM